MGTVCPPFFTPHAFPDHRFIVSSVSNGWKLFPCRSPTILCELALWNCVRTCEIPDQKSLNTLKFISKNGNLINTASLLEFMDVEAHRHINTSSDSELLLNIFANELQKTGKFRINEEDIFTAIGGLMEQCNGAYACIAMLAGFGIIAFRDPNGIRPLGMAQRHAAGGRDYMFSSESVVADACGFVDWEDVKPGKFFAPPTA